MTWGRCILCLRGEDVVVGSDNHVLRWFRWVTQTGEMLPFRRATDWQVAPARLPVRKEAALNACVASSAEPEEQVRQVIPSACLHLRGWECRQRRKGPREKVSARALVFTYNLEPPRFGGGGACSATRLLRWGEWRFPVRVRVLLKEQKSNRKWTK